MLWDNAFEIGCPRVDDQHRELIEMVAQLSSINSADISNKKLADVLRFLVGYTRYHFSAEEQFMFNIGYPQLEEHRKIHDQLIQDVTGILVRLRSGEKPDIEQLVTFLKEWVARHILDEDHKIGVFLKNRNLQVDEQKKFIDEEKIRIINKLDKLKDLFQKKLILIDDFREKRIEFLAESLLSIGLKYLRSFFKLLDQLVEQKIIIEKEKALVAEEIFKKTNLNEALNAVSEIESKLFVLRIVQEFELEATEKIDKEKNAVLNDL
ncbi:MAG: hemerythrin family protein [Candidatus Riflebacteria bacterium]